MADNRRKPQIKNVSGVAAASTSIDFSTTIGRMGEVNIHNIGPGDIYVKFDGVPGAVPADGQFTLPAGEAYNEPDINYTSVGIYFVGASRVEVIGFVRSGGGLA